MLRTFDGVAIIGSSAGASLAVNTFYRSKDKNICAISAHGRLKAGNYADSHRISLHRRAHLDSGRPSQSFYDSVMQVETRVIPNLSKQVKQRLLILTQLTDLVVPLKCMEIEGVESRRSVAFGHSGGFTAHLLADRNIIATFASENLIQ